MKFTVKEEIPTPPPKIYHLELNEDEMEMLRRFASTYSGHVALVAAANNFLSIVGKAYSHSLIAHACEVFKK